MDLPNQLDTTSVIIQKVTGCSFLLLKGWLAYYYRGLSFRFRFPHAKPALLSKWVAAVSRADFVPSKHHVVCSEHFEKDDYIRGMCFYQHCSCIQSQDSHSHFAHFPFCPQLVRPQPLCPFSTLPTCPFATFSDFAHVMSNICQCLQWWFMVRNSVVFGLMGQNEIFG